MSSDDQRGRECDVLITVQHPDDTGVNNRKKRPKRSFQRGFTRDQEDDSTYLETCYDNASEMRVRESRERLHSALEEIQAEDLVAAAHIPPEDENQEQHGVGWKFVYRCIWLFFKGMGSPFRNPLTWLALGVNFFAAYWATYFFNKGLRTEQAEILACLQKGCGNPHVPPPGDLGTIVPLIRLYGWKLFLLISCWFTTKISGEYVTVACRNTVAQFLQKQLMTGKNFYQIVTMGGSVDNHDQRITADVQVFFDTFIGLLMGNISCFVFLPLSLVIQGVITGFVRVSIPWAREAMVGTLALSTLAFILPMRRISNIFYMQQQFEGDLRYTHSRVVTHSESIAFYEGEQKEEARAEEQFLRVYHNIMRYYKYQAALLFMQLLIVGQAAGTIPYLILALFNAVSSTKIGYTELLMIDIQLAISLFQATQLPSLISQLGNVAGACHRVVELVQALDKITKEDDKVRSNIQPSSNIILEDVTIWPAGGREGPGTEPLFRNLDLTVEPGQHLVIMGPSGCGKSSMLRIIAGLWPVTQGTVSRPLTVGRGGIFFIPQKVYLPVGTLRDQLVYPSKGHGCGDSKAMASILEDVGLGFLVDKWGLDTIFEWETVLSIGERQRLGFARLFWHQPKYALMDEATSALDVPMEAQCLQKCHQLDITIISVAHRPSAIGHHREVILFNEATRKWDRRQVSAAEIQAAEETAGHEELPPSPLRAPLEHEDDYQKSETESDSIEESMPLTKTDTTPGPSQASYFSMLFVKRLVFLWKMALGPISLFKRPYIVIVIGIGALAINAFNELYVTTTLGASLIINKISEKDDEVFFDIFLLACCSMLGAAAISGAAFIGVLKALHMQRVTMKELHARYFAKKVHYVMNKLDKGLDSIDQRLVQDLSSLSQSMAWLIGSPYAFQAYRRGAAGSLFLLCIYLPYGMHLSWALALSLVCFVFFQMLMVMMAGRPVPKTIADRQKAEGALRSHHARIRTYCESIAFYGGEEVELQNVDQLLRDVYYARLAFLFRSAPTLVVQNLSAGLAFAFPYFMSIVLQFYLPFGRFDTTKTDTIIKFMSKMTMELNTLLQVSRGISDVAGYSHRVCEVLETANKYQNYEEQMDEHVRPSETLSLKNVSIAPPGVKEPLVRNLNLTVPQGQSLVVMGPSGCGKSSFLRVLAGLWGIDKGTVFKPKTVGHDGMFFVPQTSYVTQGTLRDQIVYPQHLTSRHEDGLNRAYDDYLMESILDEVGLKYLVDRWGLDKEARWDDLLSGGEQQRLGFARMFYHQPKYAVLDESTSALNVDLEEKCMQACRHRGITMVSVAHRPGVIQYHENILRLDGQGNYQLVDSKSVLGGATSSPLDPASEVP